MGEWTSNTTLELKVGFLTFTLLLLNLHKANTLFSTMVKSVHKVIFL